MAASSKLPAIFSSCMLMILVSFASGLQSDAAADNSLITRIFVGRQGNFSTIQSAIDFIPKDNKNWVIIKIEEGIYREKVIIPSDKPFIILKGKSRKKTEVMWDDHETVAQSPTFTIEADNIIVKSITFRNLYNNPPNDNPRMPACAALVTGDKVYFYQVRFFGLQDTLWDERGRHYFKKCTIQGAVDFIFGAGQSIYEGCMISVIGDALQPKIAGFITAQGRNSPSDSGGFVFKGCSVTGTGLASLGRPWRGYARVIFYKSYLSDVVEPTGWNAWGYAGSEHQLTFAEYGCYGPGSKQDQRVDWERRMSDDEVKQYVDMSFIDSADWLYTLPYQKF